MIYKYQNDDSMCSYAVTKTLQEMIRYVVVFDDFDCYDDWVKEYGIAESFDLTKRREQKKFMHRYGIKELPDYYEIKPCVRMDEILYETCEEERYVPPRIITKSKEPPF